MAARATDTFCSLHSLAKWALRYKVSRVVMGSPFRHLRSFLSLPAAEKGQKAWAPESHGCWPRHSLYGHLDSSTLPQNSRPHFPPQVPIAYQELMPEGEKWFEAAMYAAVQRAHVGLEEVVLPLPNGEEDVMHYSLRFRKNRDVEDARLLLYEQPLSLPVITDVWLTSAKHIVVQV